MQLSCIIKPKSKVDSITVHSGHSLRIKIKAPPVDGKANEYLVEYLSDFFCLSKRNIQIVSGFTSAHKRISIVAEEKYILAQLEKIKHS